MGKTTLNILPINGIIFPHQTLKLLIPSSSAYFNKNLIGTFLGICFQKDKQIKPLSVNNITDMGVAIKVTHEIVEAGNVVESSKMIGGFTLKRFKVKKFSSTTPPLAAEVELLNEEITLERENSIQNSGIATKMRELALKYVDIITETEQRTRARVEYIRSESNLVKLHYTIASYLKIDD